MQPADQAMYDTHTTNAMPMVVRKEVAVAFAAPAPRTVGTAAATLTKATLSPFLNPKTPIVALLHVLMFEFFLRAIAARCNVEITVIKKYLSREADEDTAETSAGSKRQT